MEVPRQMRSARFLLPEEKVLDKIRFTSAGRAGYLVLTDQRILATGHTSSLGPQFTLLRGAIVTAFPLQEYDSFVIGVGKRPLLFLVFIALAVGGGVLLSFPLTRYFGIGMAGAAFVSLLLWLTWTRAFLTIHSMHIKVSGRVNLCEAAVFMERLQLAAIACKNGCSAQEIRDTMKMSGTPEAARDDAEAKELFPVENFACQDETEKAEGRD